MDIWTYSMYLFFFLPTSLYTSHLFRPRFLYLILWGVSYLTCWHQESARWNSVTTWWVGLVVRNWHAKFFHIVECLFSSSFWLDAMHLQVMAWVAVMSNWSHMGGQPSKSLAGNVVPTCNLHWDSYLDTFLQWICWDFCRWALYSPGLQYLRL